MTYFQTSQIRRLTLAASALALLAITPARSQEVQDEEDDALGEIIVTSARIRQGGAQDIRHFRSVSLDGSFLPDTSSLTIEGLMGEHDLTLPELAPCLQTFCMTGHAMRANLPVRPDDQWFVGLGFTSNIDAAKWRAAPLSLVAVVDRSGSMTGVIGRVRQALHHAVDNLRDGDRFGIVHYGSEPQLHLEVTEVKGNRAALHQAIDAIQIEGSTAMEAGLAKGYEVAEAELARSHGKTRLMLFTDENPNVGDTSAQGFMTQATAGSHKGIGLTTIGVGVHFDAALATRVSSVRGGNLFFLDNDAAAKTLFERDFFNMVSEVANDLEFSLTPPHGFRVTGVFGVPDDVMTHAPEGTVTVKIGTAFLSSNGGGIFVALGKDSSRQFLPQAGLGSDVPLLTGTLRWTDGQTGASGADVLRVVQAGDQPPAALRLGHALVDEYVTLNAALTGYNQKNDRKGAYHMLDGLAQRLADPNLIGIDKERQLVAGLRQRAALVAGFAGEVPRELRPLQVKGQWTVQSHAGLDDLARGDRVEIGRNGEFVTHRKRGDPIRQSVEVNERQLYIRDADLVFNYRISGDQLTMVTTDGMARLRLRRVSEE
jgi:Ca-activated chloride channel homolog